MFCGNRPKRLQTWGRLSWSAFNARVKFLLSCKYYTKHVLLIDAFKKRAWRISADKNLLTGHSGTGEDDTGKPNDRDSKCGPGVCFKPGMCTETTDGVECAPCPKGYTGDGIQCDDIDEVSLNNALLLLLLYWYTQTLTPLSKATSFISPSPPLSYRNTVVLHI